MIDFIRDYRYWVWWKDTVVFNLQNTQEGYLHKNYPEFKKQQEIVDQYPEMFKKVERR